MKRAKTAKQKQTLPGTVANAGGVPLFAGIAAFDHALVQRFKDIAKVPADAERITSETFGEWGPAVGHAVVEVPLPDKHGDDAI